MTGALRAEFRKLFTTQVWFWLSVLALALTLLIAILVSVNVHSSTADSGAFTGIINGATNFSYLISAVLGVIGLTGEYRHLTVTPTFLSVPRRGIVIAAKLITYLLFGLALGIVVIGAAVAVAYPWLTGKGFSIDLGSTTNLRVLLGGVVTVAVFGIIGVGVGALLRNQVAAVVGIVIYLFVAEPLLQIIPKVRSAYPYLPGGAQSALTSSPDNANAADGVHLLQPWQGGLVLLAYGLVFAILGWLLAVRRDVT